MPLFEITKSDISLLNDADLRELVGRLCEAELRCASDPSSSVRWGGSQTAPDGGLDVEVVLHNNPKSPDFVPRAHTGFQVKRHTMPRANIEKEMKKDGSLRPIIKKLIDRKGAYIIVSGADDCSSKSLKDRLDAMAAATDDVANCENLRRDFYDRSSLSTWLRAHPGVALWVREKLGRPLSAWQSFGRWTSTPKGVDDSFIMEEALRLHETAAAEEHGLGIQDGIERLRDRLKVSGKAIRLTGLSGVGKTRLVQALFEEGVGEKALPRSLAVYADLGEEPNPSASEVLSNLVAERQKAILILDNCPPDVHRRLAKYLNQVDSKVSLLTIEYDVGEDQPEETDVFFLEPAGNELIQSLISRRYLHIGPVDARTIAEFSGGNARIAIALASTLTVGETVSGFSDAELFDRLFIQRRGSDPDLLRSAEALALVYSFNAEISGQEDDELAVIGSIIGKSSNHMYAIAGELLSRQLVQKRGKWRAVLPHALANKLAKSALQKTPAFEMTNQFCTNNRERLFYSFSHRLGYLHDSVEAQEIVASWFHMGGLLGDVSNLSDLGVRILCNVAPVDPEAALLSIERAARCSSSVKFVSREHQHFSRFVDLLVMLAYEPDLFYRAVDLLIEYATSEKEKENEASIKDRLKGLFQMHLSGTNATPDQRAKVIRHLIDTGDTKEHDLGFELLDAALITRHWGALRSFDFGSRSRDHGFSPRTREELVQWYRLFLGIAVPLGLSDDSKTRQRARKILAENLLGLWISIGLFDDVEKFAMELHSFESWIDGWRNVRLIISLDREDFPLEINERLEKLACDLSPTGLLDEIRAYVLRNDWEIREIEDDDEADVSATHCRAAQRAEDLGEKAALLPETLEVLGDDIFTTEANGTYSFGKGLVASSTDRAGLWALLIRRFSALGDAATNTGVLSGYISKLHEIDTDLSEFFLDMALESEECRRIFLILQNAVPVDDRGYYRLLRLLEHNDVPVEQFASIGWRMGFESISDDKLSKLLMMVTEKQNGAQASLQALNMIIHSRKRRGVEYGVPLISTGRYILIRVFQEIQQNDHMLDHDLKVVADVCLDSSVAASDAMALADAVVAALASGRVYPWLIATTLRLIVGRVPELFLDRVLSCSSFPNHMRKLIFREYTDGGGLLDNVSYSALYKWCEANPEERLPLVASAIYPFTKRIHTNDNKEGSRLRLTSQAISFLENAPAPLEVLDAYFEACVPTSWAGSRARIIAERREAMEELTHSANQSVAQYTEQLVARLADIERDERARERQGDLDREQTFE